MVSPLTLSKSHNTFDLGQLLHCLKQDTGSCKLPHWSSIQLEHTITRRFSDDLVCFAVGDKIEHARSWEMSGWLAAQGINSCLSHRHRFCFRVWTGSYYWSSQCAFWKMGPKQVVFHRCRLFSHHTWLTIWIWSPKKLTFSCKTSVILLHSKLRLEIISKKTACDSDLTVLAIAGFLCHQK